MSDEFDPDSLRVQLSPEQLKAQAEAQEAWKKQRRAIAKAKKQRRFVGGQIPLSVLARADRAHARGPFVLLVLKAEIDMARQRTGAFRPEIAVTSGLFEGLGISPDARVRIIRALEGAGLITSVWEPNKAPRVRLVRNLFK